MSTWPRPVVAGAPIAAYQQGAYNVPEALWRVRSWVQRSLKRMPAEPASP